MSLLVICAAYVRTEAVGASGRHPPHHYASLPSGLPFQGPARHRPHLRPLDLASSLAASPTKKDSADGSRRPPTLITPPLTPSSFYSNSNDTPSTPPSLHSPLCWVSSPERERVYATAHSTYTAAMKSHMSAGNSTVVHNAGYLTPTSARSQSLSSDDGIGEGAGPTSTGELASLPSGLASVEITPRDEQPFDLEGQDVGSADLGVEEVSGEQPTRLLLVCPHGFFCTRVVVTALDSHSCAMFPGWRKRKR